MIPLFRIFPSLVKKIPHIKILNGPTPLEQLTTIEKEICPVGARKRLWIKRDDMSSSPLGGNKTRKLEFLIGEALSKKSESVITFGMYGSNHALATAAAARKFGLKAKLVLGPQPITEDVKKKILAFHALGAKLDCCNRVSKLIIKMGISRLKCSFLKKCYFIPFGGTSFVGMLGYVNAFYELLEQTGKDELPSEIIVPVGSAGTAAGLLAGIWLSGCWDKVRLIGVGVTDPSLVNKKRTMRLAKIVYRRMVQSLSPEEKVKLWKPSEIEMEKSFEFAYGYHLPGYGESTGEVKKIIMQVESKESIKLDGTYSGKAMECFIDRARTCRGKMLFWLTYNSYDLKKLINEYKWTDPDKKWLDLPTKAPFCYD